MGKRKERRLAAKSAAGRRVKLDLFAEPAGDMTGTTSHDETGGNPDQDHNAGVPTSPSSSGGFHEFLFKGLVEKICLHNIFLVEIWIYCKTVACTKNLVLRLLGGFEHLSVWEVSGGNCCLLGQRPENPLLLLGQYSDDDDLDEETSKRAKHDADGSSSPMSNQIQDPTKAGEILGGDVEKETANGDSKQEPDQADTVSKLDHDDIKENDSAASVERREADSETHPSISEPSGILLDGDLAGGWKMVMHEGSNQYYYWNTVTGETSWEVPTVLSGEQNVPSGIDGAGSYGDLHTSTHLNTEAAAYVYAAVDGLGGCNLTTNDPGEYSMGVNNENPEAQLAYDGDQNFAHYHNTVAGIQYADQSAQANFYTSLQRNGGTTEQLTVPVAEHRREPNGGNEKLDVHSARLVEYSESLLQRLDALDGSGHRLEGHELVMKEIETRLSDCKALSSYGSSLLPFWWHSEAQLKQLESIIISGEAYLYVQPNNSSNLEVPENSTLKDELSLQSTGAGSEAVEMDKNAASAINNCPASPNTTKVHEINQCLESEDATEIHHSLGSEQKPENVAKADSNVASEQLVTSELRAEEDMDMDMDVEMEVDDDTSVGNMHTAKSSPPLEQLNHPDQSLADCPPLPPDEPSIPPPPDEEWIPPPPPDSEPAPPPPPEEPSSPSCPPPYPDQIPYAPYPDQYSMGYTVPVAQYYAPTAGDITNGSYYAQVEGSHLVEPQPPTYYEPAVASALLGGAVDGGVVEPVAYYDVSSAPVPSGPAVSGVQSSAYYIESGPICYNGNVPSLGYTGSADLIEPGSSSLPVRNIQPASSAVVTESQANTLHTTSVSSTIKSVEDSIVNEITIDALPIVAPKNQTKVRRKKHTIAVAPTLRSNKKVSSLVDKWKAAKEELHGDEEEEEPENAYEVLEKKRQKEIEEWRARQIVSGEAQDNANFLPLGGDWRERIKRKKAKAKMEAIQTPGEVVDDNEAKQPDLVELSKDLPSGWQAYWDESTKGIYYGNSITSETTWMRPTT
ncbi:formin-binding protein 4 isoform X1 [Iris pallida]|uniref:Formin-binding protein 4 isoform X1 n=1 Tax=Iris pallida TaxID=29817 RepID=A0AAX6E7P7_IRIPA|nr:formin-binding protein 4 isoform X1 [Iris pallida]